MARGMRMRAEMDGEAFEPRLVAQNRAPSSSPVAPSGLRMGGDPWARLNFNALTGDYGSMADGSQTWGKYGSRSGVFATNFDASPFMAERSEGDSGPISYVGDQAGLDAAQAAFRPSYFANRRREGAGKYDYETASYGLQTDPATGEQFLSPTSGWNPYSEKSSWMQSGPDVLKFIAASALGGLGVAGAAAAAGAGASAGAGAGLGAFEGIGGAMAAGGAPMTAAEFAAIGAGGAGAGAGIAPMTAAELAVSATPYANTLTPQLMAAGIPDIAGMAMAGGAGGATSSLFANEGAAQLGQWSAANPVTQASVNSAALGPTGSLLGAPAAITPTSFDALRAAEKANMGQVAGNVPSTVNMGSLGGTTATSGGIKGFTDVAAQQLRDATASGEIGGSALSQAGSQAAGAAKDVGSAASAYQTWVKENPLLARGIAAGLGGLVGGLGGGNSGGGAPTFTGPPKAWGSGLQMGIQPGAYQPRMTTAPGAVRPSSGLRMSGASRYFGG